ncbi:MAG TPA: hypothetical protein VN870_13215, partial [Streptosporangiaceae bacterium]|nr:hypothetical protein [Streptosporangiaceae bacterium]
EAFGALDNALDAFCRPALVVRHKVLLVAYVLYRLITQPDARPGWARAESRYPPHRAAGWGIPAVPGAETSPCAKRIRDIL